MWLMTGKWKSHALLLGGLLTIGACQQGEGDRCQVNSDCEDGLVCCYAVRAPTFENVVEGATCSPANRCNNAGTPDQGTGVDRGATGDRGAVGDGGTDARAREAGTQPDQQAKAEDGGPATDKGTKGDSGPVVDAVSGQEAGGDAKVVKSDASAEASAGS